MTSPSSWTVLLAACLAASPGAAMLAPWPAAAAGPPGGRRGAPPPPAPAQPQARLSVVDWNAYDERDTDGPGTYSFGYEIEDPSSGNTQFRQEERFANGTVVGSYGLVEPDGNVRVVSYVADALGYRARVENSLRKSEDYPRTKATTPRRPEWSAADRLPGGAPAAAVEVFQVQQQQQPLQWAVQSLQDGRRAPLQEQRLRPASALARAAPELNMQYLLQQDRGANQAYAQQRQRYDLPTAGVQYDDVSNSLESGADLYRRAADNRRADVTDTAWSSAPIVVWPAPAPATPRQKLPPIPLLDKLIYH